MLIYYYFVFLGVVKKLVKYGIDDKIYLIIVVMKSRMEIRENERFEIFE